MTEHKTFPGKTYVVTSKAGCDITDASGELEETCEPGKQKVIHAPSDILYTSAHAVVRETFNFAPAKLMVLGLLGGGDKVDPLMKYAQCVTVADMLAVNPDYKNDLTPAGEWLYPLPKLKSGQSLWQSNNKVKRVGVSFPELTNAYLMFGACDNLEEWGIAEFPKVTNADYMLRSYKLKTFKCKFTVLTKFYGSIMNCAELWSSEIESPMLTDGSALHSNCQKLSYFRGTLGKLEKGGNMLNGCILDKDSALHVLTTIPTWTDGKTHTLTIGIHIDHQTDDEVLAAIADAEVKGWTVTVQWNGTATAQAASTWGLRRKPIYAKVGSMVLPDGTIEQYLDWGHYVTDWEANGYMEFASLEEAKEYFNVEN